MADLHVPYVSNLKYFVVVKKTTIQCLRIPVLASTDAEAHKLALAKAKKLNFSKAHCREEILPQYEIVEHQVVD